MSAIEASSVQVKTMADGTLRLSVDIEPRHARDAFALFGTPGTPMALAALKTAAQQDSEPIPASQPETPKGGAMAKLAGMWCGDTAFIDWLAVRYTREWTIARNGQPQAPLRDRAAEVLRLVCDIDSRAELDNDQSAAARFQSLIRGPYMKHIGTA